MLKLTTVAWEIAGIFESLIGYGNIPVSAGWANLFRADLDSPEYFQGILQISLKFDQLSRELDALESSERSKTLYTSSTAKLRNYITVGYMSSQSCSHIISVKESIDILFIAGEILTKSESGAVNQITLNAIHAELQEMLTSLEEADIDKRLKSFLKVQISQLIFAIISFDVIGIDGLSRVCGSVSSELIRSHTMAGSSAPAAQSWLKGTLAFMKRVSTSVVWLSATAEGADKALEHGGNLLDFAQDLLP